MLGRNVKKLFNDYLFETLLILFIIAGVIFVGTINTERVSNCHYEYPYKNTLQHDINRKLVCNGDTTNGR